jgi:hypothetical protein
MANENENDKLQQLYANFEAKLLLVKSLKAPCNALGGVVC